jgi:hypothetical protein
MGMILKCQVIGEFVSITNKVDANQTTLEQK